MKNFPHQVAARYVHFAESFSYNLLRKFVLRVYLSTHTPFFCHVPIMLSKHKSVWDMSVEFNVASLLSFVNIKFNNRFFIYPFYTFRNWSILWSMKCCHPQNPHLVNIWPNSKFIVYSSHLVVFLNMLWYE